MYNVSNLSWYMWLLIQGCQESKIAYYVSALELKNQLFKHKNFIDWQSYNVPSIFTQNWSWITVNTLTSIYQVSMDPTISLPWFGTAVMPFSQSSIVLNTFWRLVAELAPPLPFVTIIINNACWIGGRLGKSILALLGFIQALK